MVNPIRLVSGAVTLPAHAAAAVLGTSVGIASTGARTTARVLGRVIEQLSGSAPRKKSRLAATASQASMCATFAR